MRVWHFTTSAAPSDGVSNGVLFAVQAFRSIGLEAFALAEFIAPEVQSLFTDYRQAQVGADDLLCFHHSIGVGEEVEEWLVRFPGRRWMVYHNITPELFFPPGSVHHWACSLGRDQLRRWPGLFAASLADSSYNRRELHFAGYANTEVLPLLLASDEIGFSDIAPGLVDTVQVPFNILFVGRLVANKCQHQLVELLGHLQREIPVPLALHLVGSAATTEYETRLRQAVHELGLQERVHFHGHVPAPVRNALYLTSDLYLSLSEHEGFGIPFLEAMRFGCPIAAFDAGAVSETVGAGGLLLQGKALSRLVPEVAGLIASPRKRLGLRLAQPACLERFTRAALLARLHRFVRSHLPSAELRAPPGNPKADSAQCPPADVLIEGSFESYYSLAHVNREMARAARRAARTVRLHCTEGGGPYTPNWEFLREHAGDLVPAFAAPESAARSPLGLRNVYPPRVNGLRSDVALLGPYGWEESRLPLRYVDHINHHAHGVLAMSSYVKKVLQDNGVTVPVEVCGLGVDIPPATGPRDPRLPAGDYLLHVSSGFPRKGVDLLVPAFDRAVGAGQAIGLVIKTSPNPHNQVGPVLRQHGWVSSAGEAGLQVYARPDDSRWVVVIEEDISPAALTTLYKGANALVAPSRGEGFGLPIAEAMLMGVPVIATEAGGHADFCTAETAILVPFRYARARTHLNEDGDSLWFEPDLDQLSAAIGRVLADPPSTAMLDRARQKIADTYRWDIVFERAEAFASKLRQQALSATEASPLRVALVSTWNSRCGIAEHSRHMTDGFPVGRWDVFANTDAELLSPDQPHVQRVWRNAGDGPATGSLDILGDWLLAAGHQVVLIQFSFGFFSVPEVGKLILRLKQAGKAVVVLFHSTRDVEPPHLPKSLREIQGELALCDRLLVHSLDSMNQLKDLGLDRTALLVPHGVPTMVRGNIAAEPPVLATTGFMLPQKGFHELVEAFDLIKPHWPGLRLHFLTALHPAPVSAHEAARVADRIARSPFAADIALDTRYLPEAEILSTLSTAHAIVYAYRNNNEAVSGAVRMGMVSRRPVVVTPSNQLDDVRNVTYPLAGFDSSTIARNILAMRDSLAQHPHAAAQTTWALARHWPAIGRQIWQMLLTVTTEEPIK